MKDSNENGTCTVLYFSSHTRRNGTTFKNESHETRLVSLVDVDSPCAAYPLCVFLTVQCLFSCLWPVLLALMDAFATGQGSCIFSKATCPWLLIAERTAGEKGRERERERDRHSTIPTPQNTG